MNDSSPSQRKAPDKDMTFTDIFINEASIKTIEVPEYQRAYSWEKKQIDLFIRDLVQHQGQDDYYLGHFILEEDGDVWGLVDGQQRLTTVVLFLLVCRRMLLSSERSPILSLLERFRTVKYDQCALDRLMDQAHPWPTLHEKKLLPDEEILTFLQLNPCSFTVSQKRLVVAATLLQNAFDKGTLVRESIPSYLRPLSTALCSRHITYDKAVAVSVFEMHNTRGVPLKLIEVIKAKLMRFVYLHGGEEKNNLVSQIQSEFAEIHAMEERLEVSSFRGDVTIESILRHHLRVIDDGDKKHPEDFDIPEKNASSDKLTDYIDQKLSSLKNDFVTYPLSLACELKKSVRIVCGILPAWDKDSPLVGDVMILKRNVSCEFFLLICRRFETSLGAADGRVSSETLGLWEKLLYTHDFHGAHYNLKGRRDNFAAMYARITSDETVLSDCIREYLAKGFRPDCTPDLQKTVKEHLVANRERVLNGAYGWWSEKMIYALYKYEIHLGAVIRGVLKDRPSVEHILPQEWQWVWSEEKDCPPKQLSKDELTEHREKFGKHVSSFINGIGNLLLITGEENSRVSNSHPADKQYTKYCSGGSYALHEMNREAWCSSTNWERLIRERGEKIYDFIMSHLLADDEISTLWLANVGDPGAVSCGNPIKGACLVHDDHQGSCGIQLRDRTPYESESFRQAINFEMDGVFPDADHH